MKRIGLLIMAAALVCGCSFSRLKHGDATAINSRWFWVSEGFEFTHSASNETTTIKLQKSNPDAEALGAVAAGAAKGAIQGAK